jgi:hypothetical protein
MMQIHNRNGENEISEFYFKRSDEDPPWIWNDKRTFVGCYCMQNHGVWNKL